MPRAVTLVDRHTIESALTCPELVPHGTTDPSDGATIALRGRMARFSGPDHHAERRASVDAVIARIDASGAERVAVTVTSRLVATGAPHEAVVRRAPSATMLALLELPLDAAAAVDDIESVVRVIGRGEAADVTADAATERLLAAVPAGVDPIAAVSLLYQNFDATAALLRNTLAARAAGSSPEPAVRVTKRVATAPSELGRTTLSADDEVVLEIGAVGLPFGFGPHACPGRDLAEAIVRGVIAALDRSDLTPPPLDRNV